MCKRTMRNHPCQSAPFLSSPSHSRMEANTRDGFSDPGRTTDRALKIAALPLSSLHESKMWEKGNIAIVGSFFSQRVVSDSGTILGVAGQIGVRSLRLDTRCLQLSACAAEDGLGTIFSLLVVKRSFIIGLTPKFVCAGGLFEQSHPSRASHLTL